MKDLTPEQRQTLKVSEYILGDKGGYPDEDISEAVIIGYNVTPEGEEAAE